MRFAPAWILLVPAVTLAGGNPIDDTIRASKLAALTLSAPNSCAVTWADAAVAAAAEKAGVTTLNATRNKENLETFVGSGYAPATLRIAYREGKELDRLCGCGTANDVATWLLDVSDGQTHADRLRVTAQSPARDVVPIGSWIEVAQAERCADRLDDAYKTLVTLWNDIPRRWPEQRALRLTRVAYELGALAEKHEPARVALVALRDALDATKDTDLTANDEWVALNRVLHDDARTVTWFEAARVDPAREEAAARQAPNVFSMWFEQMRLEDAGALIDDPIAWLGVWRQQPEGLDGAVRGYVALRAAGRPKDAATLAKAIFKLDKASAPGWACTLLSKSAEYGRTGKDEKAVAKVCEDEAVVAAWAAALP